MSGSPDTKGKQLTLYKQSIPAKTHAYDKHAHSLVQMPQESLIAKTVCRQTNDSIEQSLMLLHKEDSILSNASSQSPPKQKHSIYEDPLSSSPKFMGFINKSDSKDALRSKRLGGNIKTTVFYIND